MPLSEFLRLAIEKLESSRKKSCPTDLSSPQAENNNDLVQDDDDIGNPTTKSVGNFGEIEEGNLGLNQNDEIVPWLSYSVDDDGMQDYCSELLPEISEVTGDGILPGNSSDQTVINLETDFKIASSSKSRPFCSWLTQQGQMPDPRISNIVGTYNNINTSDNNNQDSSFFNSSNFSRPSNPVKDNLENSKVSACRCNNKAILIERSNNLQKNIDFQVPSAPTLIKSRKFGVKESKESFLSERTENLVHENNERALIQNNGVHDVDRSVEPVVACSSVGSGNSADRVSCEQTHNSKRKFVDIGEFECHSEDVETESVGVKKRAPARGGSVLKRSRAAEVHNLSERRRRDRINEKMRALQELIPNCNKVDKASMLDEAIEYLKNLQLQVQMMSMGAGLCMPQMMFHHQHMHPHFSAMSVGMGMRFGMGMPMQGPHFPSSASGAANFPSSNLRAPLLALTARPQVTSSMISSALRVSSYDENKNLDFKNNVEGSNQSSAVHEINQAKDVRSRAALTSTTATSKRG